MRTSVFSALSLSNWISVIAAVVAVTAAFYANHGRQVSQHPMIGFVDVQAIMKQSDAGKSLQSQLEPRQAKFKQVAEAKLKELQAKQKALAGLSGADKNAKLAELQQQIDAWNTHASQEQAAVNEAAAPATHQIEQVLREELQHIAAENNYTAVLPTQYAYYSGMDVDVTSEAMRRLNARLSKVDVSFKDMDAKDADTSAEE